MASDNKLTFDPPTRLPELTQNLIRSFHGHFTPSLKISCKSVLPFSRNVADKETNKETKKEIARKQYPVPGVINYCRLEACSLHVDIVMSLEDIFRIFGYISSKTGRI